MKAKELTILPKTDVANVPENFKRLSEMHAAIENDVRNVTARAVQWGAFALEIKSRLKHGQFKKALEEFCPEISYRTAARWMDLANEVLCRSLGVNSYSEICHSGTFDKCPVYMLLELPKDQISEEQASFQEKIISTLNGKSIRQLLKEFHGKSEDDEPAARGGDHTKRDKNGKRIQAPRGTGKLMTPDKATQSVQVVSNAIGAFIYGYDKSLSPDQKLERARNKVLMGDAKLVRELRELAKELTTLLSDCEKMLKAKQA